MRSSWNARGALLSPSRWRSIYEIGPGPYSGFGLPSLRPIVVVLSAPAVPIVGDALTRTLVAMRMKITKESLKISFRDLELEDVERLRMLRNIFALTFIHEN
jgi:hypothetical protein